MDPGFDFRKTVNLGRMIERWGLVPIAYLSQFSNSKYSYGYVGSEDFTMYPVLLPGSFIQIDESANTVSEGNWRSEYERPIYFPGNTRWLHCLLVFPERRTPHPATAPALIGTVPHAEVFARG
jgi:hypothetical protein